MAGENQDSRTQYVGGGRTEQVRGQGRKLTEFENDPHGGQLLNTPHLASGRKRVDDTAQENLNGSLADGKRGQKGAGPNADTLNDSQSRFHNHTAEIDESRQSDGGKASPHLRQPRSVKAAGNDRPDANEDCSY